MANEVMRVVAFTAQEQVTADSVFTFQTLEAMTIVGISLEALAFTGTPTGFNIDIQDDEEDVITAVAADTALTPGTWLTPHFGGVEIPVHIAAGSEVEVDVNLVAGTAPTADFTLLIYYLAGMQQ